MIKGLKLFKGLILFVSLNLFMRVNPSALHKFEPVHWFESIQMKFIFNLISDQLKELVGITIWSIIDSSPHFANLILQWSNFEEFIFDIKAKPILVILCLSWVFSDVWLFAFSNSFVQYTENRGFIFLSSRYQNRRVFLISLTLNRNRNNDEIKQVTVFFWLDRQNLSATSFYGYQ